MSGFGNILLSAVLSTGRFALLCLIGMYLDRLGILGSHVNRHISRMGFQILVPCIVFISIATASASGAGILVPIPIFMFAIGVSIKILTGKIIGMEKLKMKGVFSAMSSIANSLGLPIVFCTSICQGENQISKLYTNERECMNGLFSLLGLYNILGGNIMIFIFGKYFLDFDQESMNCALKDETAENSKELESKTETALHKIEPGSELTEEIVVIKQTRILDRMRSSKWYSKGKYFVEKFFTPPINATFLGIFISEVKPIQRFLFQSNHEVFAVLSSTISEIGHASIPVNLFVLGSDLSHGPDKGILEYRQIICTIINKQILLPASVLGLLSFFRYKTTLFSEDQTAVMFIILLESCMPPAVGLSILSQVNGFAQKETSSMLFFHYVTSLITSTIWITTFLAWL